MQFPMRYNRNCFIEVPEVSKYTIHLHNGGITMRTPDQQFPHLQKTFPASDQILLSAKLYDLKNLHEYLKQEYGHTLKNLGNTCRYSSNDTERLACNHGHRKQTQTPISVNHGFISVKTKQLFIEMCVCHVCQELGQAAPQLLPQTSQKISPPQQATQTMILVS